ncbi:hypothetical protein [Aestuariivita sp.]|jgi:hypothetical protein|uniref:hypothetical protein n=1 Tax=Aestuariivita sp. TaxID=1872407 RepID=UPI00217293C7|nr:hypothetical protein [Aestuariivita sp.]MCE8005464.1 hypothetical protein [Aestuariivita sp.]
MINKTRIIAVAGTALCAIGIGFFMQSTSPDGPGVAKQSDAVSRADFKPLSEPVFELQTRPQASADALLTRPDAASETGLPSLANEVITAALGDDMLPAMPAEPEMPMTVCDITSTATVEAGAMVRFTVEAPCLGNENVVVHHNGMMFSAVTDEIGSLDVVVPALSETAILIAEFENGEGSVATAQVSSLPFYDRVVLQWRGDSGFQLHAREFGANYGDPGHVWAGATRDVAAAALGEGGFVTRLGTSDALLPRLVEVYTFPTGTASQTGEVALSIEVEVTAQNCGTDIEAQAMELDGTGMLKTQYITLAVAECSSIGDFLVLNNLVDDLKIATN